MRKSTFLVSLLLCAAGAMAQAPKKFIRMRTKAPKTAVAKKMSAAMFRADLSGKRKADAGQAVSLWKPTAEVFYIYEEGEWLPMASSTMTYDKAGNPLTVIIDEDGLLTRTTYTYDANNMQICNVLESDESGSGEEWIYEEKTENTYDPVVTDFMTSKMEYKWDDVESDWGPGDKQSQRKTVTRDAEGRVVSVERSAYFSYTDSWDVDSRIDITYDEATGKAVTYAYRQSEGFDPETGKIVLGAPTVYRNIEWENTDGQILEDFDGLLLGANRFKKADTYWGEDEDAELMEHCEVVYQAGKKDFVLTVTSADGMEKMVNTYTVTDENGSFVEEHAYYMDENEDGDLTEDECIRESLVMKYDKYGNCTLEEYRGQETPDGELEMISGTRTLYTYDEATNAVEEALQEEYMVEYDDESGEVISGQYEPMMKITYSDFADVTAVRSVTTADAGRAVTVYNLQGVAVGTSTDSLPAGIYLVKKGTAAYKVVKR